MENNQKSIPEDVQNICREFAQIALKHNLHDFSATFRMPYSHEWGGNVGIRWEWGRHGDDAAQLHISSSFSVNTNVNIKV
jgi:hypothetical protein